MKLIDEIITEITDTKVFGKLKYLILSTKSYKEIKEEFEYEFGFEYFDQEREVNKNDIEEYFKLKIVIDDKEDRIKGDKKYLLLAPNGADNRSVS